jgi:hypothetical protein
MLSNRSMLNERSSVNHPNLNLALVDKGGFTNLDHANPKVDSRDFQADPDLYGRT